VYGGKENDPRRPFLTLRPGDRYDLANRRVISRAIDKAPITESFVDQVVGKAIGSARATIVVAQNGTVLVNKSWNVPDDSAGRDVNRYATYMPTTTVPQFPLGDLSRPLHALIAQSAAAQGMTYRVDSAPATLITQRLYNPMGMHRTTLDQSGQFRSNVDELYRVAIVMDEAAKSIPDSLKARGGLPDFDAGWIVDEYRGTKRLVQYAESNAKRAAFMRFPQRGITIIFLTDSSSVDAKKVAEQIAERLLR
jgi:cyanophycinase